MIRARLLLGLTIALCACSDKKSAPNAGGQPSPNANILPAPLASAGELSTAALAHSGSVPEGIPADSAGRLIVREPEPPPPETAAVDRPLSSDSLTAKDVAGYSIAGEWRWADVPPPAAVPEVSAGALRDAAQKTELTVAIDLASVGRLRVAFESATFPLPSHAELRARTSAYGHVLVWPDGGRYRVLLPGSLRAMFAERRADVAPLLRAKVTPGGTGSLLGHKTLRTDIETSLGTLTIEQTTVPGSGMGGALLCRMLVELVGAEPTVEACRAERVPLAAHYRWMPTGSFSFVATSLVERKELPLGYLFVPPAGAAFSPGELPPSTSGVFLTQEDLARTRSRPVRPTAASPRAPGEGIIGENQTSILQYLLIDGVPVAWVKPRSEQYVIGPPAGRYSISWRDFFGSQVTPPTLTDLPARVRVGSADGDAGPHP